MNRNVTIKSLALMAIVGFMAATSVEAACKHCKRGYKNVHHRGGAYTYAPYDMCETGGPNLMESELVLHLDPAARQIYYSMNQQDKDMVVRLAGDNYRYDKNAAVFAVREMRNHSQNGINTPVSGQQEMQPETANRTSAQR